MFKVFILCLMVIALVSGCVALRRQIADPNSPVNHAAIVTGAVGSAVGTTAIALPEPWSIIMLTFSTVIGAALAGYKHYQVEQMKIEQALRTEPPKSAE